MDSITTTSWVPLLSYQLKQLYNNLYPPGRNSSSSSSNPMITLHFRFNKDNCRVGTHETADEAAKLLRQLLRAGHFEGAAITSARDMLVEHVTNMIDGAMGHSDWADAQRWLGIHIGLPSTTYDAVYRACAAARTTQMLQTMMMMMAVLDNAKADALCEQYIELGFCLERNYVQGAISIEEHVKRAYPLETMNLDAVNDLGETPVQVWERVVTPFLAKMTTVVAIVKYGRELKRLSLRISPEHRLMVLRGNMQRQGSPLLSMIPKDVLYYHILAQKLHGTPSPSI